jgi:hypothetical protein
VIRSADHSPWHSPLYIGRTDEVPTNRCLSPLQIWAGWPIVDSCLND